MYMSEHHQPLRLLRVVNRSYGGIIKTINTAHQQTVIQTPWSSIPPQASVRQSCLGTYQIDTLTLTLARTHKQPLSCSRMVALNCRLQACTSRILLRNLVTVGRECIRRDHERTRTVLMVDSLAKILNPQ